MIVPFRTKVQFSLKLENNTTYVALVSESHLNVPTHAPPDQYRQVQLALTGRDDDRAVSDDASAVVAVAHTRVLEVEHKSLFELLKTCTWR